MFAIALGLLILLAPASYPPDLTSDDDVRVESRTIVLQSGDDDKNVCIQLLPAGKGPRGGAVAGNIAQCFVTVAADDLPKVWVGVRLTPVPAPLAAHIGEGGVMIGNVVADSPADRAGLEQYDVIVRFNKQQIDGPQDLSAAIADAEPGRAAKMELIRAGQSRTLKITPLERPADLEYDWKYEEPAETFLDSTVNLHGMTLNQGPGGHWTFNELGPLQGLPDALKELDELDLDFEFDFDFGPSAKVRVLELDDDGLLWHSDDDDDDKEVRIEIRLQAEDDGSSTSIRRDTDGEIHVTRTDADGSETSATYDNFEEFENADPEAAKMYPGHAGGHRMIIKRSPSQEDMRTLRREYQIDVHTKLQEALEHARDAQHEAAEAYEKALKKHHVEVRRAAPKPPAGGGAPLGVRMDDNGTITVFVRGESGKVIKYQFTDKEAFKAAEPDLYEQFRELME